MNDEESKTRELPTELRTIGIVVVLTLGGFALVFLLGVWTRVLAKLFMMGWNLWWN